MDGQKDIANILFSSLNLVENAMIVSQPLTLTLTLL